jgi:deoxycytidylate deaminase
MMTKQKHNQLDHHWLKRAQRISQQSPHPTVKVGAVVTSPDGVHQLGLSANAPPDGILLTEERLQHGEKSLWFMCAEKRALAEAQRHREKYGLKSLRNCRIYSTLEPCHTCAHDIIQAGIKLVCAPIDAKLAYPKLKKKYRRSMQAAAMMFAEAGVVQMVISD